MGTGMAGRLLKAGTRSRVHNRTPSKMGALLAQGAKAAADVAEACRGDAVVTMLLGVPMPIANILHDRFLSLIAHGESRLDWSAIGQLAANGAALPSGSHAT